MIDLYLQKIEQELKLFTHENVYARKFYFLMDNYKDRSQQKGQVVYLRNQLVKPKVQQQILLKAKQEEKLLDVSSSIFQLNSILKKLTANITAFNEEHPYRRFAFPLNSYSFINNSVYSHIE